MRKIGAMVGGAAVVLASGAAMAADPVVVPPVVVAAPAPMMEDHGFDWTRLYAGAVAGVWFLLDPLDVRYGRVAAHVGKLFAMGDRALVGAEVQSGVYFTSGSLAFEVYGLGRAGFLATDRLFVYGTVGVGVDFDPPAEGVFLVGGGAEFAIGDRMSVRSDLLATRYFGEPFEYWTATLGVSWFFGR